MMPDVYIPSSMRSETDGRSRITASGSTVGEVIETIVQECPNLRPRLLKEGGYVQPFVALFVNSHDIRTLEGLGTIVGDRDEIHIVGAIAGG
jgi:sulfur-carrier protein